MPATAKLVPQYIAANSATCASTSFAPLRKSASAPRASAATTMSGATEITTTAAESNGWRLLKIDRKNCWKTTVFGIEVSARSTPWMSNTAKPTFAIIARSGAKPTRNPAAHHAVARAKSSRRRTSTSAAADSATVTAHWYEKKRPNPENAPHANHVRARRSRANASRTVYAKIQATNISAWKWMPSA